MEKDVNRLRLAKEALESGSYDRETIEYIFPELKESENEKIREELLNAFQESEDSIHIVLTPHRRESFIAWLKKQGEQKPDDANNRFIRMRETKPKDISEFLDRLTTVEQEFLWEHIAKIRELDKEEQKPADKVEPKFKVDNWIVYKNDIWKVCNISLQNYYELLKINNEVSTRLIKDVDEDAHLWTIQDAKDGDVLTYSDSRNNVYLCIYKEYKNERVYDYCTLDKESFWEHGNWNYLASFNYAPATKEQLNTLLKAIVYAGYTFDFEKKELKKIKQKSIELDGNRSKELSLSLQIQAYLNTASDELYAKGKPLYSEKKIEYIHKCILMWQKLHHAYFYQKPVVWSKEDEKKIDSIIETIRIRKFENPQLAPVYEGDINWLKSLRPQSTWKPSDEQIEILDMVLSNESMDDNVANILRKLREQLKKLREE